MQSRGGWVLPSACFAMLCQLQLQTCLPPANLTALTMQQYLSGCPWRAFGGKQCGDTIHRVCVGRPSPSLDPQGMLDQAMTAWHGAADHARYVAGHPGGRGTVWRCDLG